VKLLRSLSTGKLLVLVVAVVVAAVTGTAIAIAAGGGGPAPPQEPLAQAIHDGLTASKPEGVTARIRFTNKLFPTGALEGRAGSALMSGASGRIWLTNDGRGRLELQSTAGDVQIVWGNGKVTVYDASSNTVYRADIPASKAEQSKPVEAPPSLADIGAFLTKTGDKATISPAQPTNVAGEPAYRVDVSPKDPGGLLGSIQLAWDAARGVPLRVAVYARGGTKPVLALEATDIRYGRVSASNVEVSPPAGARTVDLAAPRTPGRKDGANGKAHSFELTSPRAVEAAAGFPVVAPDRLAGLRRSAVRLVGSGENKSVLVVYGEGLGAIVILERAGQAGPGAQLAGLPEVDLGGVRGRELSTPLGTIVSWRRGAVSYVLAGSVESSIAEAAASALK
jgi:outer membrane lipoprotein-sorting protein